MGEGGGRRRRQGWEVRHRKVGSRVEVGGRVG